MNMQLRGGQQDLGRSIRALGTLVTRQVLKIVFDVLLLTVGLLLVVASRFRRRIQSQITRDVLFEIASDDGVARRFGLHAATRTISLEAVSEQRPDTTVRFGCALDGIRTLVSTRTTARIVEGMNYGNTRLEGNPVLLLWFHALTRTVVPIGSTRRPRLWRLPPIKVREPERHAPWAARITREPAIDQLDPTWQEAWVAREKLLQVRACNGEPLPPG